MPLTPNGARTFLLALSDFWPAFFKDRAVLDAYAEALALDAAQLYQSMFEAALGVSLRDMPLYARVFFKGCPLREDRMSYREGATPDDDRFIIQVGDALVGAEYLTNRILAPTAFLTSGRDYDVVDGAISFRINPFRGGDGEPLTHFPLRTLTQPSPSTWVDPLGRGWGDAQPGDFVRVRVGGSTDEALLSGVEGAALHLRSVPACTGQDVARRGAEIIVLRTPYDGDVVGRLLMTHPTDVYRATDATDDGVTINGQGEIDIIAEPSYAGAWASSTAYARGALVNYLGTTRRARLAHTSGLSFEDALWDDFSSGYFYVEVIGASRSDGLFRATTSGTLGRVALEVSSPFDGARRVRLHRVTYAPVPSGSRPEVLLPHTAITSGTFEIVARRIVARATLDATGAVTVHPAGGLVARDVDYYLHEDTGRLTVLSAWDPSYPARANYAWRLAVIRYEHRWRGAYVSARTYTRGDLVLDGTRVLVVRETHVSDGTVDAARYLSFVEPARTGVTRPVREIGAWATDALIDEQSLYRNYGALLDRPRATSEAYRVFLMAVSRLFLVGPTFERFESALNAVANLPLVRNEGERLLSYSDGVVESGNDALIYGRALGHDGGLVNSTSRFTSLSASFLPTDVGASLRIVRGSAVETYVVSSYVSVHEVGVSPAPIDGTGLQWSFQHPVFSDRLRLTGGAYRFTEADVGAVLVLASTRHAHNRGLFRIVAIDDPLTVALDSEFGLMDDNGVSWKLSPSGVQRVTTSRTTYEYPLTVPMRVDVTASTSVGVLTFSAFEALTRAFHVVDYLEDPTWWHRVTIPEELMEGSGSRRTVTPELIEHVYGAIDGAQYGDDGLYYGADDEGRTSPRRIGEAIWYGDNRVVLAFAPGVSGARPRDVGQHLVGRTERFHGSFKVLGIEADGITLRLDRFPPPEAEGLLAPQTLTVELPPLIHRRTVAFVLMDRALKYHSVQVRVDPAVGLSTELLEDTLRVVRAAKPSHVFVFFETGATFLDAVAIEEDFGFDLNHELPEPIRFPDALSTYSGLLLRYGDNFQLVGRSVSFTPTPGAVQTLATSLPSGVTAVRTLVKVGFNTDARVGSRRPVEGVDYVVDYVAGTVTVNTGVTITPDPVTLYYVDCIRRVLDPSDPIDAGETPLVYGGTDPTFVRAPDQGPEATGLVDRAVQLTLGS